MVRVGAIDVDRAFVERLIGGQFPRLRGLPVRPVEPAGTDNVIFRLGADLAVRLPRRAEVAARVDTETRWLPRLAPQLPLAVPSPYGRGTADHGFPYPWSVHRWLDGQDLTRAKADLADAAVRLGRFVGALHRIDAPAGPRSFRGGRVGALDERVRAEIRDLSRWGVLAGGSATAAWEAALAAPDWTGRPVWLHADLHPANLIARDGRLAAVIDFGRLGVGDPACDLLPAWTLLTADTRALFRAEVGVDDATWARSRGWALALGIGAAHFFRDTDPVLAGIGLRSATEVLSGA